MRKIISLLLVLTLVMSLALSLSACNNAKAPEIPEGYKLYENEYISFAYPEDWSFQSGSVDMLVNPTGVGNNITIVFENKTDAYENLTVESFNETLKPSYEAMGMTVSNVDISKGTSNNASYVKLSYNSRMSGVSMKQTAIITTVGDRTYSITVTEVSSDAELLQNVIDTLYSKK